MENIEEVSGLRELSFTDYKKFNKEIFMSVISLSKSLKGKRIFHINSTAASEGGGVAQMLHSQVAAERDLRIDSRWFVIKGPEKFFLITKKIHNFFQGEHGELTSSEYKFYINHNKKIASELKKIIASNPPHIIKIHDFQPLPLIFYLPKNISVIFRSHIDFSTPNSKILNLLLPIIEKYDIIIFHRKDYSPKQLSVEKIRAVPFAIDPLSGKNKPMSVKTAKKILANHNINPDKPLVAQVSRFDYWKDPVGVIKAYYFAKNEIPDLQLILSGIFVAKDDPEAIGVFKQVQRHAKGDPDIFLFSEPYQIQGVDINLFVNAVQTASDVIMQNSIREGFGMTVTEAMWKGKPVVGGKAAGIALQIENGKSGFLVSNSKEAGETVVRLLKDGKLRKKIGEAARTRVKNNFLLPRLIRDNLAIYKSLLKK